MWRSILFSILYFVGGFIFYRFAQTELVDENSLIELLHLVSSTEFFTGYTTATLEKLSTRENETKKIGLGKCKLLAIGEVIGKVIAEVLRTEI